MNPSREFQKKDILNPTMLTKIIHLREPQLTFGGNQSTEDPRDGLLLYGPYEKWGDIFRFNAFSVSAGVIGTKEAYESYKNFVKTLKAPILSCKKNRQGLIVSNETQRPSFPGFEAVFNIHWPESAGIFVEIKPMEIESILINERNRKARTNKLVDLYLGKMLKAISGEDTGINIWFVLVPRILFLKCRPNSFGSDFSKLTKEFFQAIDTGQGTLFAEEEMFGDEISRFLDTSSDFHHLLKARANLEKLDPPIQILVEPKLSFRDILHNTPYEADMKAFIAWSLSTTLYYKLGKKPWRLAEIRPGVCYLGLVFKKFQGHDKKQLVCSAAQLFMSDGDGTIFRGNNGLWLSEKFNEIHLDEQEAYHLLCLALEDYFQNNSETYPKELFIHGRATFSDKEWAGFCRAVNEHQANTKLVGIVIRDKAPLKLFRDTGGEKANFGVLRGISTIINEKEAYIFTRGFVPRMNTSMSLEIPNPLHVSVTRGEVDIEIVLGDIMALTKLNYNACIYGDGKPVTLRFSDAIGGILTATDRWKEERRQFKYYI